MVLNHGWWRYGKQVTRIIKTDYTRPNVPPQKYTGDGCIGMVVFFHTCQHHSSGFKRVLIVLLVDKMALTLSSVSGLQVREFWTSGVWQFD